VRDHLRRRCSTDGSAEALRSLTATTCTRVIRFRRNFGQTAAVQAGIEHSVGDVLVFLDGDLQNDPADIPRLLDALAQGNDVVSGWRKDRQDKLLSRRLPSQLAKLVDLARHGGAAEGLRLHPEAYRREVLENVHLYGEMHRLYLPSHHGRAPRSQRSRFTHHARKFGTSKYGISRTFRVLLDLLTVKFLGSLLDQADLRVRLSRRDPVGGGGAVGGDGGRAARVPATTLAPSPTRSSSCRCSSPPWARCSS